MGTEGGLVDFPRLMRALTEHEFTGWITVEHDKANIGGDYAESTALSMWYAKHVWRRCTHDRDDRRGYAINQWKPNFDDFTRREQHGVR